MNAQQVKLPVELCGGPFDGHRDEVSKPEIDQLDVHLFGRETEAERMRCAYRWTGRTTRGGKRWVLMFECVVSRWFFPIS